MAVRERENHELRGMQKRRGTAKVKSKRGEETRVKREQGGAHEE